MLIQQMYEQQQASLWFKSVVIVNLGAWYNSGGLVVQSPQ